MRYFQVTCSVDKVSTVISDKMYDRPSRKIVSIVALADGQMLIVFDNLGNKRASERESIAYQTFLD